MFRRKKSQSGAIEILLGNSKELPIDYQPQLLVKDLIDAAAAQAGIKTIAKPFFALYDAKNRHWLYPYRCISKEEAAGRYSLLVQLQAKNSIELRRIDATAFEYFFLQCRSRFVVDSMNGVDLNDALRLACLDMRLATIRLKMPYESLRTQFPVDQFLPKSVIDKFTQDALAKVLRESFKNFVHMQEEAVMLRYVEIVERQPEFHVHSFPVITDCWSPGETVSLRLSYNDGITVVRPDSSKECVSAFGDLAAVRTSSLRNKLYLYLTRRNGSTVNFLFPSLSALDTFVSFVDGYYQLLVDASTSLQIEGLVQPETNMTHSRLPTRRTSKDLTSPTTRPRVKTIAPATTTTTTASTSELNDINEKDLYHGPISRDEAKRILEASSPCNGYCVVRENARVKGGFSLSVWNDASVRHYLVELHSNGYGIQDGLRFATVHKLLEHYKIDRDGLCCNLTKILPPARPSDSPFLKTKTSSSPPVPESPRPGRVTVFPSQQLNSIEVLSKGQFGLVSKATLANRGLVCVKSFSNSSARLQEVVRSLCPLLVRLNNAKLVKCLGVVSNGGNDSLQVVYEFVELGPLDAYLSHNKSKIDERSMLLYSSQIASGLAFLEAEDCAHGGLTAHGVLVASPDLVKISDVGLATKAAFVDPNYFDGDDGGGKHLIRWLAVECLRGPSTPTPASDIWSFGVVLWEIYNYGEKKPFEGLTPSQVKNLVISGQRLDPAGLPKALADIMLDCWKNVPSERPPAKQLFKKVLSLAKRSSLGEADFLKVLQQADSSLRRQRSSGPTTTTLTPSSSTHVRSSSGELPSLRVAPPSLPEKRNRRSLHVSSLQGLVDAATRSKENNVGDDRTTLSIHDLGLRYLSRTNVIEPSKLHLGKELGHGEFGRVRQATWKRPDGTSEETAVKMLTAEGNRDLQQEFLREAKAMIELDNLHIVRLIGICFEPTLLLVTELVPLGAVNSYLRSLTEDQIKVPILTGYALQIAKGMTYLEVHRVVHRDLAARNVLVANPTTVKITDFGLSRIFGDDQDYYVAHTKGKWPIKWYAPESINHQRFTHKSDVWSYGITLWEIFSLGTKPYAGMKPGFVVNYVESGKRLSRPEKCPESVYDNVLLESWKESPDDRPTFVEIARRLGDFADAL